MSVTAVDSTAAPSRRLLVGAGGLYAGLALWVGRAILSDPRHIILGGPADNLWFLWAIWWFKRTLMGNGSPFFVPNVLYPDGWHLAGAETAPAYTVLGLPITAMVGVVAAYNIFVLGSFVIAGLGAFLLAHRVCRSGPAALLAGTAFAFCPYHTIHALGHLNLMGVAWIPWAFWFLEGAVDSRRARHVVGAAVAYGLAALSSWYYAYFVALFVPLYAWLRLRSERRRIITPRGLAAALLFAAIAAAMVVPALLPVLRLPPSQPMRHSMSELIGCSASPTDFALGNPWHPLWGGWVRSHLRVNPDVERVLFLGWVTLALAAIGLARPRRAGTTAFFWVGLAGFVLALGPMLHWGDHIVFVRLPRLLEPFCAKVLYTLAAAFGVDLTDFLPNGRAPIFLPGALLAGSLPLFTGMRVMGRFGLFVALAVAVLAGFGLARLTAGRPRRAQWLISLVALALVMFEFAASLPVCRVGPSPTDRWVARQPGQFTVAYLPVSELWRPVHLYGSLWHGKRLLGASGTFMPPAFQARSRALEGFPDAAAHRVLVECGVKYVLVNTSAWKGGPISAPWLREADRIGDTAIYEVRPDRSSA